MAPTQLTNFSAAYTLTPVGAAQGLLDKAFQASDNTNGNFFVSSGSDLLIVWNTDTNPHTFTIQSAADQFGRFQTVTYNILANAFAAVRITTQSIYTQANGQVILGTSSNLISFLPLQGA